MRLNIAILIIFGLLTACDQHEPVEKFVAYSWDKGAETYPNLIPFYWLKEENFGDLNQFVADAKAATDKMPEGHRILFSWNLHRLMAYQSNGDFLYTAQGDIAGCNGEDGFVPYRSLWWDNGVERVRNRFEQFFRAYAKAGGELDVLVLDFEQGFSYWHLLTLSDSNYECGIDHYLDALQHDARFAKWQAELGFDFKTLNQWYSNDNHLIWAAIAWKHLAGYINTAIYQPLKKYFPDADFSNYGYYYQQSTLDFPNIHGYYLHRYTEGVHVGTHQSREIYGWVNLSDRITLDGLAYPSTPFNAFRFALNKNRAMLLSSKVPASPWVSFKSFEHSHLAESDYYQELIFHMLLTGNDYLLYWNPSELPEFQAGDDRLLNDLLQQANQLIGEQPKEYLLNDLVDWRDDMVISKVKLKTGRQLWRLSVKLEENQIIDNVLLNERPARFTIAGTEVSFAGMQVLKTSQRYSDKGIWLVSMETD